jgi:hypothetical protein
MGIDTSGETGRFLSFSLIESGLKMLNHGINEQKLQLRIDRWLQNTRSCSHGQSMPQVATVRCRCSNQRWAFHHTGMSIRCVINRKVSKLKTMYDAAAFIVPGRNPVKCQISQAQVELWPGTRDLGAPSPPLMLIAHSARLPTGQGASQ